MSVIKRNWSAGVSLLFWLGTVACVDATANVTLAREIEPSQQSLVAAIQTELEEDFQGEVLLRQQGRPLYLSAGSTIGNERATPGNLYVIGSISKTVFAAFYLEQHAKELNQPLEQTLLPAVLQTATPLTPLMLLSHTSGINRNGNGVHDEQQAAKPAFVYSNANYQLLAKSLFPAAAIALSNSSSDAQNGKEKTLRTALNDFFNHQQLDIHAETGELRQIAARHPRLKAGFAEQLTATGPVLTAAEFSIAEPELASGFLIASVEGIADFQDRLFGGQLLSAQALDAMTTPWAGREHRWGPIGYGLGLQIAREPLEYSHSGYVPGYMSLMLYYPESGLQLVMLENVSRDLGDMTRAFAKMDKLRQLAREFAGH